MRFNSRIPVIVLLLSSFVSFSFSSVIGIGEDSEEKEIDILFREIKFEDLEILIENEFDQLILEDEEEDSYWDNVWDENPVFFGLLIGSLCSSGFCIFLCGIFFILCIYCCCCKNSAESRGYYDTEYHLDSNVNDLSRAEMASMPFNRRGSEFAKIENRPSSQHPILMGIPAESKRLEEIKEFLKDGEEDLPPPYSPSWKMINN